MDSELPYNLTLNAKHEQTVAKLPTHEIIGEQHPIISQLIEAKAITNTGEFGLQINDEILTKFADEFIKDNPENYDPKFPKDLESSGRRVVRTLVSGKVISAQEALMIGKNFRPSRMQLSRGKGAYTEAMPEVLGYFGVTRELWKGIDTRDRVIVGNYGRAQQMLEYTLQRENIDIQDKDELIEQAVIAHEYGHVWHAVMARVKAEQDKSRGVSDEQKVIHYWVDMLDEMQAIFPIDLPEFGNDKQGSYYRPEDTQNTSIMYGLERISMGFEQAFLRQALLDRGITNDKIANFLQSCSNNFECLREAFLADYQACTKIGIKYKNVVEALYQKTKSTKSHAVTEVYKRIRGPKEAGYSLGLNQSQLRQFLDIHKMDVAGPI